MMNRISLKLGFQKEFQKGFTLIELMITMVIFVFVIAAVSKVFTGLLTQFKQQSKVSETNIEKTVGLQILRQDLEGAGYGLPWDIPGGNWAALAAYNEANVDAGLNDGAPAGTIGAPRGIVSSHDNGFGGSDHLVIKSTIVTGDTASQRWTWVRQNGVTMVWPDPNANPLPTDYVITLTADEVNRQIRTLVLNPDGDPTGAFSAQFNTINAFAPQDPMQAFLVMSVNANNPPRMPFNRADYFISNVNTPARCAGANVSTGVLVKAILSNSTGAGGGNFAQTQPLIDCVANMQVAYGLDMNQDGTVGTFSNVNASAFSSNEGATTAAIQTTLADAALLRQRLREIRIYVLAHEGQIDFSYNFVTPAAMPAIPAGSIRVGEVINGANVGIDYPLGGIPNWQNYRWKVYTLVAELRNLMGR